MLRLPFNPFGKKEKTGEASEEGGIPPLIYSPDKDGLWHHPAVSDLFADGFIPARMDLSPGLGMLASSITLLEEVMSSPAFTRDIPPTEANVVAQVSLCLPFYSLSAITCILAWIQVLEIFDAVTFAYRRARACVFEHGRRNGRATCKMFAPPSPHRASPASLNRTCPFQVADAFAKCGQMARKMPGHSMADKAGVAMVEAEEMARRAAAAAGWLNRAESPHAATTLLSAA